MSVVRAKYPQGHPFLRKNFLLDGTAFSLAYCRYIVPKYSWKFRNDDGFAGEKIAEP